MSKTMKVALAMVETFVLVLAMVLGVGVAYADSPSNDSSAVSDGVAFGKNVDAGPGGHIDGGFGSYENFRTDGSRLVEFVIDQVRLAVSVFSPTPIAPLATIAETGEPISDKPGVAWDGPKD